MIPGFSTRLWWEAGSKSCMINSKDWRSKNVNVIELNCKVVKKKWQPPPFLHQTPFTSLSPLSSKRSHTPTPQVTQFLESPTHPPPLNSVCHTSYLRKHNIIWLSFLVHMCKMMTSLDAFFSFSKFWFSKLFGEGAELGQKIAQNDKNYVSYSVSQEPYLIRLWFSIHLYKMMVFRGVG